MSDEKEDLRKRPPAQVDLRIATRDPTPKKRAGRKDSGLWDWSKVEQDYRQGVLSIEAIRKKYGMASRTSIMKKAKAGGWKRDLLHAVRERLDQKVRRAAVKLAVVKIEQDRTRLEPVKSDEVLIEEGAQAIIQLVREHRGDIRTARELINRLMEQLRQHMGNRDFIIELVRGELKDVSSERKAALIRACSLPQTVTAMKDLAYAMKMLLPLERQAFGLEEYERPTTSYASQTLAADRSYPSIEAFAAKVVKVVPPIEVAASDTVQ